MNTIRYVKTVEEAQEIKLQNEACGRIVIVGFENSAYKIIIRYNNG